jgi:uncharacterized protein with NRDE domain
MCLILLAWRVREDFPLVVAANRDEFHGRPAAAAGFWSDRPEILAGRDLQAQGTWLGVSRGGRFAAVTNYRGAREPSALESRGALVVRHLEGAESPESYVQKLVLRADNYSGFNLLASDRNELWWMSNRGGEPHRLEPGIYGLGNTLLDSPEVDEAKARFRAALEPAPAVEVLFGVLAQSKIVNPLYGTRCSSVLLQGKASSRYAERPFLADGTDQETVQFEFGLRD